MFGKRVVDVSNLEKRAEQSFDYKYIKKQLRMVGVYRLKRSNYFSFFLKNYCLELSPNRYFNTSWYTMQNPETRFSDKHPYLTYLETGYKDDRLPNEFISLEEVRDLRINTDHSPVEVLQERFKKNIFSVLGNEFRLNFTIVRSLLKILKNSRHDSLQRIKLICKIYLAVNEGRTYRSAYENYARICSVIGNSTPLRRVLKTDAHNESGRYAISIPLTPILARFSESVVCIELDSDVIKESMVFTKVTDNLELRQGSITHIPCSDSEFDCILDFSTIDHLSVEDSKLALQEYVRVSNTNPLVVIVVWTSSKSWIDEQNQQTYYSKEEFRASLDSFFKIYFEKPLLSFEKESLVLYVCSKEFMHGEN